MLDDEPFGEKLDPSAVIRDGDELQLLLQQLSENPATAESARELVSEPAINWRDAKQFFDRARWWREAEAGDDSAFHEKLPEDGVFAAEIFAAAFENAREKARSHARIGPNQTRAILESRRAFGPTRIPRAMVPYFDADALSRQLDIESVPPRVPEYLELPPELCLARCKRQMVAKKGNLTPADLEGWRQFFRDTEAGRRGKRIPRGFRSTASLACAVEEHGGSQAQPDSETGGCFAAAQGTSESLPHLALRRRCRFFPRKK